MAVERARAGPISLCLRRSLYALYRTLDCLAKAKGLGITARVLASLPTIKSGDIILPLVDGRELWLRRVSRPDPQQAELLTRLGVDLPERIGTDSLSTPM